MLNSEVHMAAIRSAITQAALSSSEDDSPRHPFVGAVVVKQGEIIAVAHKGEQRPGDHAEFTLLEGKLEGQDLSGGVLYTTLEPCTNRSPNKVPCADRIVARGLSHVVIGMLDPDPSIGSSGVRRLRDSGLEVTYFPPDENHKVRLLNEAFIRVKQDSEDPLGLRLPRYRRLDDWYNSVNSIYLDKNFHLTIETVFTHLVETVDGLDECVRRGDAVSDTVSAYIAKCLAWWLAICAKAGFRSVEDVVWAKYPGVCPYCEAKPHDKSRCKRVGGDHQHPDWESLARIGGDAIATRPASISAWQRMFSEIYEPESLANAVLRLHGEVRELAAAVRLLRVAPGHMVAEGADVFAWLMQVANSLSSADVKSILGEQWLANSIYAAYPDGCIDCEQAVCNCPAILARSVRRIAREASAIKVGDSEHSMFLSPSDLLAQFDVGSTEVTFAGNTLSVVEQKVVRDIYEVTNFLLDEMKGFPFRESSKESLRPVLQSMLKFAASHRVNQATVDRLLTVCEDLSDGERASMADALAASTHGPWQKLLAGYLHNQAGGQRAPEMSSEALSDTAGILSAMNEHEGGPTK